MKNIFLAIVIILSSCASNQERKENNGDLESLPVAQLHGNFRVTEIRNNQTGSESIIFRFDSIKREMAGHAGCNRFISTYTHRVKNISFQPGISTKMYCEGKMKREQEIIELLPEISEIIQQKEEIIMLSKDNELLIKLEKTNRSE